MTDSEREQWRVDQLNARPGPLEGFQCPECLNRGYSLMLDENGYKTAVECRCMARRRSERYIAKSGLSELLTRYTLRKWQEREGWQKKAADMVRVYIKEPSGWLFIAGSPGTGKTHLCTALCGNLMAKGYETRYMLWRDISTQAKACINDGDAYQDLVVPLKRVKVLYIDDLFKTGKGQAPTTGDVNLAFEILNARYNDSRLLTVISSEWTIKKIMEVDEAVGSRISERTKGHYADLTGMENWRLK